MAMVFAWCKRMEFSPLHAIVFICGQGPTVPSPNVRTTVHILGHATTQMEFATATRVLGEPIVALISVLESAHLTVVAMVSAKMASVLAFLAGKGKIAPLHSVRITVRSMVHVWSGGVITNVSVRKDIREMTVV